MDSELIQSEDVFECCQCGDCCKGFGGTYVNARDIQRICAYIHFDPKKFVTRYCEPSGSRHVLALGKDGYCIFFDPKKQCTIHPVKPYMCRAWPFIQTIIDHPENWNAMANSCPGIKKDVPHEILQKIAAIEKAKLDKAILKQNAL